VRELWKLGPSHYEIIVIDNLSTGHKESIPPGVVLEIADIRNKPSLIPLFEKYHPVAVFHFCAFISVSDSVVDPFGYYENNVVGTLNVLQLMHQYDCKVLYFSLVTQFLHVISMETLGD
jgi:UDP-glucose 4-epimerase